MRDIKFRAWNTKGIIYSGETDIKFYIEAKTGKPKTLERFPDGQFDLMGVNWLIMQYTGLKDKNGVEIYEGDIIKHPDYYRNTPVIFDDWYSRFACQADEDDESIELNKYTIKAAVKVLGNIYENPELLKES